MLFWYMWRDESDSFVCAETMDDMCVWMESWMEFSFYMVSFSQFYTADWQ